MEFVGNKNEVFASTLPSTNQYPELKLSEFQSLFYFLSNETEVGILQQAKVSRIKVHKELKEIIEPFENLVQFSQTQFGDDDSANTLYKQAIFALTASELIGIQISTNASAEAADRQDALTAKKQHCDVQYRQAVDLLLHGKETYCFEVV